MSIYLKTTMTRIDLPTCNARQDGKCCAAEDNWVWPCPDRSRRVQWSVSFSQHRLGPYRSRRAARSCIVSQHAQRTDARPCGSAFCCSCPVTEAVRVAGPGSAHGCRWRCSWSADACSFHWGCRLWWRPDRGCMGGWDLSSVAGLYLCQNVYLREESRKR